jgi:TrmH family RNA methyltransferase
MAFERISKGKLKECTHVLEKRYRREHGVFVIEGVRLFEEFLRSGFDAEWIVVAGDFAGSHPAVGSVLHAKFRDLTFEAAPAEVARLADTENAQGIVACVRARKTPPNPWQHPKERELVAVLDRIADPGNAGTILRSAEWFGVNRVALGPSCVEVFNPKVVRATMGALFRLLCYENTDLRSCLEQLKGHGYRLIATSSTGSASIGPVTDRIAVVVGSEANGVSPELLQLCDERVSIPRFGHGESLNASVAASIVFYEYSRQLQRT